MSAQTLRTRVLGDGGPEVTVVALGCNNFGGHFDESFGLEEARAVIDAALDEGITLFDTADYYAQGHERGASRRAPPGAARRCRDRDEVRHADGGRPDLRPGSAEYVRWACEQSLRRLRTDRIDL